MRAQRPGGVVVLALLAASVPASARAATGEGTASVQTLEHMVADLQNSPDDQALREKIITLARDLKPAPVVPKEARRPFMKAVTFQQEAQSSEDYDLAIGAYQEALLLAPWWPEAYYNLSVAQEAAGKLDDAMRSLALYLLTGPADAEEAENRLYALEARQEKAAKALSKATDQARTEESRTQEQLAQFDHLIGRWRFVQGNPGWPGHAEGIAAISRSDNEIKAHDGSGLLFLRGTIQGSGEVFWEHSHPYCGWQNVDPYFPNQDEFSYSHFTYSDRACSSSTIRKLTKE